MIDELGPTVLFECVGGDLAGDLFRLMPAKSIMVVYGNLTKQKTTFEPQEFHWADKQIVGLMMFRWVSSMEYPERRKWFDFVADDLANGGHIFGSKIFTEVPLEEWLPAITESEKAASSGKFLINCRRS